MIYNEGELVKLVEAVMDNSQMDQVTRNTINREFQEKLNKNTFGSIQEGMEVFLDILRINKYQLKENLEVYLTDISSDEKGKTTRMLLKTLEEPETEIINVAVMFRWDKLDETRYQVRAILVENR